MSAVAIKLDGAILHTPKIINRIGGGKELFKDRNIMLRTPIKWRDSEGLDYFAMFYEVYIMSGRSKALKEDTIKLIRDITPLKVKFLWVKSKRDKIRLMKAKGIDYVVDDCLEDILDCGIPGVLIKQAYNVGSHKLVPLPGTMVYFADNLLDAFYKVEYWERIRNYKTLPRLGVHRFFGSS